MSNQPSITLTVHTGPQAGQTFQLTTGAQTIGRTAQNQIVISERTISKQHARLTVQPDGVFIQDLGSSNGTFVNGRRVSGPTRLQAGDIVQIGTSVRFGVQGGPAGAFPAPTAAPRSRRGLVAGVVAMTALLVLAGIGAATWFVLRSTQPGNDQVDSAAPGPGEVNVTEESPAQASTPSPLPAVTIDFTVDKTIVKLGECATLRWRVENAKEVRLDGERVPEEDSRKVCPQEASKTYRLTALSAGGETTEQAVTLTVPPTLPPPPGVEIEFTAGQSTVNFGECTTLSWSVQNAQEVRLDGKKVGAGGTEQVCPKEPANTYTLLVQSLEGENVEQTVIINVPATPTPTPVPTATLVPTATPQPKPQSPYVEKFIADQTTLNQGSCTSLRWSVRNAQTVQLSGGEIGSQTVGNEGARRVCPPANGTTYNLVASGSGGSDQRSITLAIIAPTPTPVIVVVPQPVAPSGPPSINVCAEPAEGICYIFRWDIQNVKEIYFDGEGVTGHDSRKVCDADALPGERGNLRIVHLDGHSETISAWSPCD